MSIQTLDKIFKPQRIALVGVTPNPKSVGGKILINLVGGGFRGVVYPVNSVSEAVCGIPCIPRVKDIPKTPDLAIICAAAGQVPGLVRECGDAGILGIIIASAGFREAGPRARPSRTRSGESLRRFEGMRIIGPNCLGVISPGRQLNASFAADHAQKGNIAFISQSGALGTSVLDWALEEKIGFSDFVSIGNTARRRLRRSDRLLRRGREDQVHHPLHRVHRRARRFMTAARAFARTKPIVAYKAGRFPESAAVAASHTGALAGEDAVYDAAFRRTGVARVFDIGEIFDVAELVGRHKIPKGARLAVVTNAGGPGVMASDALIADGGVLARLAEETMARLNDALPPMWSRRNPVDVLGDAKSKLVAKAIGTVLQDPGVGRGPRHHHAAGHDEPDGHRQGDRSLAAEAKKPILAAWLGGASHARRRPGPDRRGRADLQDPGTGRAGVHDPGLVRPEPGAPLRDPEGHPRGIPLGPERGQDAVRRRSRPRGGRRLAEDVSKALLEAYGIPTTLPRRAATAEEAARLAGEIGYPVVLKILSPDITHKTDVGGVALDLEDEDAVRTAFGRMMRTRRRRSAPRRGSKG